MLHYLTDLLGAEMLYYLMNLWESFIEGLSFWIILNVSFKRSKRYCYVDALIVVSSAFMLCFLNLAVSALGTILTVLLQLLWANYCLEGKVWKKVLCVVLWNGFIIFAWGFIWGYAWLTHLTGDTPLINALLEDLSLRSFFMCISSLLLGAITIVYARWKRRTSKRISFSANAYLIVLMGLILFVHLLCTMRPTALLKMDNLDYFYMPVMFIATIMTPLFLILLVLYDYIRREGISVYQSEQRLQRSRLEKRHSENIILLEQELNSQTQEMRRYLCNLKRLLASHSYGELEDRESEIDSLFEEEENILTGNTIFDIVLNQKISWAKQREIHFQVNIQKIESQAMEETDIVSLLSNLLDNACEAAEKCDVDKRYIYLEIKSQDAYLFIMTENPYQELSIGTGKHLHTTKKNRSMHGRGMGCIRSIAQKYGGSMQYSVKDSLFTVRVVLKIKEDAYHDAL